MWKLFKKRKSKLLNNQKSEKVEIPITSDVNKTKKKIKSTFNNCSDVIYREISIGKNNLPAIIVYIDGLVKTGEINEYLIEPINRLRNIDIQDNFEETIIDVFAIADMKTISNMQEVFDLILSGEIALFIDKLRFAYVFSEKGWDSRNITEPESESTVRGPKEGFIESIRTNTALIRRRIKTPQLKMEAFKLGKLTKTDVVISYLDGVVKPSLVEEVRSRLRKIDVDSILDSNYIEEMIEDGPFSIFPTIQYTERPDKVAANILEGRIAIIVDGSPNVLLVPTILIHFLNTSDDYYESFYFAFFVRILRLFAFIIALFLPSFYIAITTFHQEMIPTKLLMSIIGGRDPVPFPSYIEALMMELAFELLREAGLRLPKTVGSAVSIVGALVIGQAAVEAGLVSPAMVIVVSVTAVASFSIPAFNLAISLRVLRFLIMTFAAILGLYGVLISMLFLVIHVVSLRSFGIPYLTPLAPFSLSDWKDYLLRFPWWQMEKRPLATETVNQVRQNEDRPNPPQKSE
ncbi:hypothetical protein BHF71_09010 [Vulcanibacillus modesticaldus]|uniref:Spore germination protein n=1 Tax=Vulcanibacillus modesticaldus TaxID=337097 RepID=A0A1D2YUQ1_9BACI|nr:spore germination protein [Vulcanibacillus modesticaldus]OEF99440.1 hypothetical protein BHF71_09010 [Vulcanibacillus modesticaldus]